MKPVKALLALVIVPALSIATATLAPSFARAEIGHESGGGSLIGGEFISRGYMIYDHLSRSSGSDAILSSAQLELFHQALISTRVEVVEFPIRDSLGQLVDARTMNDPKKPGHKLIQLNHPRWQAILAENPSVYRLIFHEYLWAMELDDTNFRISHALRYPGTSSQPSDPHWDAEGVNLDFEQDATPGELPAGWFALNPGYRIATDPTESQSGNYSARISAEPGRGDFGTLIQCISPQSFLGRKILYRGLIKTSGVSGGWASLWLRVDGPGEQVLAFDNMQNRGSIGTTAWTWNEIRLPVAPNAVRICFGMLLAGDGTLWADRLSLKRVDH